MARLITRVLDATGTPIAYEADEAQTDLELAINAATELTLQVPNDGRAPRNAGEFLERVRVTSDGSEAVVARARVSSRRVVGDTISYSARLDASLLEGNVTPANYGAALSDVLLEDFARAVLAPWRVTRADFTQAVTSSNVDLTSEPGRVLLAKTGINYRASGNIVVRFDLQNLPNAGDAVSWDRIRWESDYFDSVKTTMAWRSADTPGGGTWSSEIQGADPAGLGVAIQGVQHRYLDVRVTLTTSDTTTPFPDETSPTVRGVTPILFGVEVITRAAPTVAVDSVTADPSTFVRGVQADRRNALDLLVEACEQTNHEFVIIDGRLTLAKQLGSDRTGDLILVDGRNSEITTLEDDDRELVNRLHAWGQGTGLQQPYALVEDPASIQQFGVYESTEQFEESTIVGLQSAATAYLSTRAFPEPRFSIDVNPDLLGLHAFNVGDKLRIARPETDSIIDLRITTLRLSSGARGDRLEVEVGAPHVGILDLLTGGPDKSRLELLPPVFRAVSAAPGVEVRVGHAPNSRGVSFEVHYSTSGGFTPDATTLRGAGSQTVFTFPKATPNQLYYVRVCAVDRQGNRSAFAPEQAIRAGRVVSAQIGPGAVTETKLGDRAVSNPKVSDDAVSARTIQTDAIIARHIQANAITLPKLNDDILGTSTHLTSDGISVRQGATEVLKLGGIAGKAGVPAGRTQGLWGALGTGVHIQGVPRLIAAGAGSGTRVIVGPSGPLPSGYLEVRSDPASLPIHGLFTVPAGKAWAAIVSLTNAGAGRIGSDTPHNLVAFSAFVRAGGSSPGPFTAGTYPGMFISPVAQFQLVGRSTNVVGRIEWAWLIIEYDV